MSTNHYANHQKAAELHDAAAHAHRVAEQHGQEEHLSGAEHSRQALEHSEAAHLKTQSAVTAHGITTFSHLDIAALAHKLWLARGCPEGSSEQDWFHAAQELRARAHTA
jgi:uncharacterized protein YdcH (DUF465 family)